jgi:3'-5' exonuclease
MLNNLLIFDIETVPDFDSARRLLHDDNSDANAIHLKLAKYHKADFDVAKDNPNLVFLKPVFHQIVAISFMHVDLSHNSGSEVHHFKELRSGGNANSSEKELIDGFFAFIAKHRPKLVSYNGRSFDLPVLQYRALKHKTSSFGLYQLGDKWNNYLNRYSLDWHTDLIEALSNFGAATRVSMNELCASLNLPGKIDVDGLAVYDLYKSDKVQEIRDYCETDVLNTYLIYLHYALHFGIMNKQNFETATEQIEGFLTNMEKYPHYDRFRAKWRRLNSINITA